MRRLSILSLSLLLAACNFAPKYQQPDANLPGGYPDDRSAVVNPQAASGADLGWREVFKDPRLQALIAAALDHNRDLREAIQNVEAARAQYGIERAGIFPHIDGTGSGNIQKVPGRDEADGADPFIQRSYSAEVGMTNFELDLWGRRRNLSEAAFNRFLATDQARQAVQLNLVGEVASTYFKLRANQTLLDISRRTAQAYQRTYDLVKVRFESGVATALELNQAKTTLETAKARIASSTRGVKQSQNALEVLTGRSVDWASLPPAAEFTQSVMLDAIPAGLPSMLLVRRPDIRQAEFALRAANADIGAARAAFFPNISLTAGYGIMSGAFDGLFNDATNTWSFRPSLTLPIFHAGELKNSLNLAEVRSNIAVTQYEKAVQIAFQEVADGLAGESTYRKELDALREKQQAAYKSLDIANLRYKEGIDSFLQVQSAQIDLFSVQQEFLDAALASLTNRTELYKALGGGWSDSTIQHPLDAELPPQSAPINPQLP